VSISFITHMSYLALLIISLDLNVHGIILFIDTQTEP
jgi:hypothetical protein